MNNFIKGGLVIMTDTKINREDKTDFSVETKPVARTQWQLIWKQFKRHKLALFGLYTLLILYVVCVAFPGFFAPYSQTNEFEGTNVPPHRIRFVDVDGNFHIRPFVYNRTQELDMETFQQVYTTDTSKRYPIKFFVRGDKYSVLGLYETDIHLFGVEDGGRIFLFGSEDLGRDLFSRVIYAGRVSLTIGFVGVFISMILGLLLGGISGLAGGVVDELIQRIIELLMSIPKIPLWMALAAAIPQQWSAIKVYFAITIILSFMGWTGIARVARSKFISLREEDFVAAAHSFNAPMTIIIIKHLIPNFMSYLIVRLTLAIPGMIIAETSLSFLGVGLKAPVVSLGVLLQRAQSFQTVSLYPWLLLPGLIVVIVVLSYNFVGDGLRDAADPYS